VFESARSDSLLINYMPAMQDEMALE